MLTWYCCNKIFPQNIGGCGNNDEQRLDVACHLFIRGVRLAKNDFGSVFGSVCPKTAVFGSVSVLPN